MKSKLLAIFLLAGSSMFARTHFSIGVGIGVPAYGYYAPAYVAPPPVAYVPLSPGPGYTWQAGYWYPVGPRSYWRAGYWAPPVYGRSYVVAPRYYGRGYDRDHDRRYDRDYDHDHDGRHDRDDRDYDRGYYRGSYR